MIHENIEISGSLNVSGSITSNGSINGINLTDFSSSIETQLNSLKLNTSSIDETNTTQNNRLTSLESVTGSYETKGNGIVSGSSQIIGILSSLNTYTSSNDTTNTAQNNRLTALETKSGSVDSSISNINSFTASNGNVSLNTYTASVKDAIVISGTDVTVVGNLQVQGTTTTIDSTTVNIGDNIIELNGTGAALGGLMIGDVTAPNQVSGSLLWDSNNDYWIAGASGSESKVLVKNGDGVISGSSQVSYPSLSNIPSGIVSGSSQITLSSTTGYGSVLNQAVLTSSSPTFGGLTLNGAFVGTFSVLSNFGDASNAVYRLGDGNTGLFRPAANTLGITTDGTERMRITSIGTVGIGTTTPTSKLHIDQDASTIGLIVTGGSGGVDVAQFSRDVGGNTTVGINGSGANAQMYFQTTGNTFAIGTSSTSFKISDNSALGTNDRLTIDNSGNVGIGTATPEQTVHIVSPSNAWVVLERAGTGNISFLQHKTGASPDFGAGVMTAAGDYGIFNYGTGNTSLNILKSNGNVGIGTEAPAYKLDVSGDVRLGYIGKWITETNVFKPAIAGVKGALLRSALSTEENPSFSDVDDTNTGLFFPADDNIAVSTNGTERLRVNSSGNVGIGTNNPYGKLEVYSTSPTATNMFRMGTSGGGGLALGAEDNTANPVWRVTTNSGESLRFVVGGGTQGLFLDPFNNVGIGTETPSKNLEVIGTGGVIFREHNTPNTSNAFRVFGGTYSGNPMTTLFNNGYNASINQINVGGGTSLGEPATEINFYTGTAGALGAGTARMKISSNGNIGVGTASPHPTAILDLTSTTKGLGLPLLTTTQINAISSPRTGLTVYNTTESTICFYDGSVWKKVTNTNL